MAIDFLTVVGPTACGKTRRAVECAKAFNGEIISGDSRQVYRGMTIGTGKDLIEYGDIPYHLIDICEAGEKYNLHRFLKDAFDALDDIKYRNKFPIVCGGSGMYVEALCNGLRLPEVPENKELRESLSRYELPELTSMLMKIKKLHNTTDIDTKQRAIRALEIEDYYQKNPDLVSTFDKSMTKKPNTLIIGIDIPREQRRERISSRLNSRLAEGMIDEVSVLLKKGLSPEDLIYYGLEYKYVTLFLIGKLSYEEMKSELEIAIHQFAKRQMTWFRGMERRGFKIHWLSYDLSEEEFIKDVSNIISNHSDN